MRVDLVTTYETCDRCGPKVRATVRVKLASGDLTFCGHCWTQYGATLAGYQSTNLPTPAEMPAVDTSMFENGANR